MECTLKCLKLSFSLQTLQVYSAGFEFRHWREDVGLTKRSEAATKHVVVKISSVASCRGSRVYFYHFRGTSQPVDPVACLSGKINDVVFRRFGLFLRCWYAFSCWFSNAIFDAFVCQRLVFFTISSTSLEQNTKFFLFLYVKMSFQLDLSNLQFFNKSC